MFKCAPSALLLILIALMLLSSCSTEKRLYNRGFHIEWREVQGKRNNGEYVKTLQARKVIKVQSYKNYIEGKKDAIEIRDSLALGCSLKIITKEQCPSTIQPVFPKLRSRHFMDQSKTNPKFIDQFKKSEGIKYYDEPYGDVSSGLGGFLTSLVALLILFGANALFWGLLLLLVALAFCVMGILEQINNPDTTDLIFAVLGLCICGFAIFYFQPIIWSTILYFVANPGVLLLLLLILGIYLLMNA